MSPARRLIVIGGGEHSRVVLDAALSQAGLWEQVAFVDPQSCPETVKRFGATQLQSDAEAMAEVDASWFVLGIGPNPSGSRRLITERYSRAGVRWATVIHTSAVVSSTATLGEGTVVLAGAIINTGAVVGAHVIVNTSAAIEHDVRVGDFVTIAPGVVIGGGASIGEDAYLAMRCVVRDHVHVGRRSVVGMGAVVVAGVNDGVRVLGVPARIG